MAEYNGIQEGGANAVLNRRLNTEAGAPAPNLAPEILPVIQALEYTPELDYYAGRRNCAGYGTSAAVAANYSGIRLRNPVGSRTLLVIDRLMIRGGVTEILGGLLPIGADLASMASSTPLDSRIPTTTATTQTVGRLSVGQTGTPSFTTLGRPVIYCQTPTELQIVEPRIVIAPGFAFDWYAQTVNIAIIGTMFWYERSMTQNELG